MSYFRNAIGEPIPVFRANIASDDPTKLSFKLKAPVNVRVAETWKYTSPSGQTYSGVVTQATPVNAYNYYYVRINRNGVPFTTVNGGTLTKVANPADSAPIPAQDATPPVKAEDVVKYEDPMEASFAPAGMDLKKLGLFALAGVAILYVVKKMKKK